MEIDEIKFEPEDLETFKTKKFSERQIDIINKLNPEFAGNSYGKKGSLRWEIFIDGELTCELEYKARDVDGDWGNAWTHKRYLTFEQLVKIIKSPNKYFDTRSWN